MADNKGDFLVGLLIGSAIGATLALLYAPQAGDDTRESLKKKGDDLKGTAGDAYARVKVQTSTLASQVKDSSATLAASVKDSANSVAERVSDTVEKVREDVVAGVTDIRTTAAEEASAVAGKARGEVAKLRKNANDPTSTAPDGPAAEDATVTPA